MDLTGTEISFDADALIVSKTDVKGTITYGNRLFIQLSGYSEKELLGQPHNIVRHEKMPKVIFKKLWDTVKNGEEIYAYVVNLAKDGSHYWVFANVTPSFDQNGTLIGFYSVRRKPTKEALEKVKPLYQTLLELEASGGESASEKYLTDLLSKEGVSYEQFILSL